ncbi:pentatricopeptide repeat-containing protein At3g63370, chloroplastic-like [Tasmannia lanceolata]|uniref:pentatricopeptide repeat-containing protein At3g63370, chloroplastic-like n=1 Tax=Tasmannia lanceolata TaxID=3420 RepID=UPI0040645F32
MEIHAALLKSYDELDVFEANALVVMYSRSGRMKNAVKVFEEIDNRNYVSGNSMLSEAGIEPDTVTLVSVFSAIASLSAMRKGKQVHGFVIRRGLVMDGSRGNLLVDMYARCGNVDNSCKVFDTIKCSDLMPDHVAFLALFSACSHLGFGDEGVSAKMTAENHTARKQITP